jgi:hypothetical protein
MVQYAPYTVQITFANGAWGLYAANIQLNPQYNKSAYSMDNAIPKSDGSFFKRAAIKTVKIPPGTKSRLRDLCLQCPYVKDNTRLEVHDPTQLTIVPLIINGNYINMITGQITVGLVHICHESFYDNPLIWNSPREILNEIDFTQGGTCMTFTHVSFHPRYLQILPLPVEAKIYEIIIQDINFLYGPVRAANTITDNIVQALQWTDPLDGLYDINRELDVWFSRDNTLHPDMIGSIWCFEDSLGQHLKWGVGLRFLAGALVHHEGNLYLNLKTHNTEAGAAPPEHTVPGQKVVYYAGSKNPDNPEGGDTAHWQYLNSGRGYAKYIRTANPVGRRGAFFVQKSLPPVMFVSDPSMPPPPTAPFQNGVVWYEGAYSKLRGFPNTSMFFGGRFILGGGIVSVEDASGIGQFNVSFANMNKLYYSSSIDMENMDTEDPDDTSAGYSDAMSQGGSAIVDLQTLSSTELLVRYDGGISLINYLSGIEQPEVQGAGRFTSTNRDITVVFAGYILTVTPDQRDILAIKYSQNVNQWEVQNFLENYPDITKSSSIKRLVSVERMPSTLLILLENGELHVYYEHPVSQIKGFFQITTSGFITDVDWASSEAGVLIYILVGVMNKDNWGKPNEIVDMKLGLLDLERPTDSATYVDWADDPEMAAQVKLRVDIGDIWIPNGVAQGSWCRADRAHKVRTSSKGKFALNGQRVTKNGFNELTINKRIDDEISFSITSDEGAFTFNNLEVSYLIPGVMPS